MDHIFNLLKIQSELRTEYYKNRKQRLLEKAKAEKKRYKESQRQKAII
jgi:hypothetical protein